MGIRYFGSVSESYDEEKKKEIFPGNPVPWNMEIERIVQIGCNTVALIRYPDCKNYEGRKILLYRNHTEIEVSSAKSLDPHFNDKQECISPFARFEPTDFGWLSACAMAKHLCWDI